MAQILKQKPQFTPEEQKNIHDAKIQLKIATDYGFAEAYTKFLKDECPLTWQLLQTEANNHEN